MAMNRTGSSDNAVPNSRLFILGGKGLDKEDWQATFGEYGEVQDVWIVKDRRTGDDKGNGVVDLTSTAPKYGTRMGVVTIRLSTLRPVANDLL